MGSNGKIMNYIAKAFAIILIFALIYLIGYGIHRDKVINKSGEQTTVGQKVEQKVTKKKVVISDNKINKNKNWLAIGDSITVRNEYQKYVKQSCGFANVTTIAANGITLHLMDDKITKESLKNIDVVTVFAPANDFGWSRPLGAIDDPTTVDTFYSDMKCVIKNIKELKPGVKLIFITTPYIGQDGYGFSKNTVGCGLEDYNKAMKEVCALSKIPILDLYTNSGINSKNLLKYSDDSVSPNDVGMKLIGTKIGEFLNTH